MQIIKFKTVDTVLFNFIVLIPIFFALFFVITASILSPYYETKLMAAEYNFMSNILSNICHQYPSRCFSLFGSNMGLCSRCISIYSAILIGCIFLLFIDIEIISLHRLMLFLLLTIPLIIDGLFQFIRIWDSTNMVRSITGILAGIAIAIVVVSGYISFIKKQIKGG